MKEVNRKQLTSNDVVNKIILANLGEDDMIAVEYLNYGVIERKCINVVLEEFRENRLTKEECHLVFDEQFHLSDKILSMGVFETRALIPTDYRLDLIVQHHSWQVRDELAKFGKCVDILKNDRDFNVRITLAKHGHCLDTLVKDNSISVREAVAKNHYRLDLLMHDTNWIVRRAVAESGYASEVLKNDESYEVRKAAIVQIRKKNK
jgi:hypothetical protein